MKPQSDEYMPDGKGLRHVPTGIRITLKYQNVLGDWTIEQLMGDVGRYDQNAVVQMGTELLIEQREFADRVQCIAD